MDFFSHPAKKSVEATFVPGTFLGGRFFAHSPDIFFVNRGCAFVGPHLLSGRPGIYIYTT